MKKAMIFLALAVLLVSLPMETVLASGNSALQGLSDEELLAELNRRMSAGGEDVGTATVVLQAKAIDKLSTRSGPSTSYRETETYNVIGETIRIISRFDDANGVCWVQCDIPVGSTFRRLYTGLKRFDTSTVDIYSIPLEMPLGYKAKVISTSKAMYGPGGNYGTYGSLTVDKGQTVTIITLENGYAQVEWKTSKQMYRAWVLESTLSY